MGIGWSWIPQGPLVAGQRDGARGPCTDYDVISVTARWYVGRIFTEPMTQGERWRWSITSVFMEGMPSPATQTRWRTPSASLPRHGADGWRRPAGTRKRRDRATDRRL